MEPDFESTTEAQVARVEMRSITSSQVLARPSEWLELLRRYGNVAPFFLPVTGTARTCSKPCRLDRVSAFYACKGLLPSADLAALQAMMDAGCGVRATQVLTLPYLKVFQFIPRACLVFSGELKDFDACADRPMPFRDERAS